MMSLILRDFANPIHESQGGLEIGKLEGAHEVMFVDDIPQRRLGQLLMNFRKLVSLQRRHSAAAGNAISVCEQRAAHEGFR
jgi:hypothetical protein